MTTYSKQHLQPFTLWIVKSFCHVEYKKYSWMLSHLTADKVHLFVGSGCLLCLAVFRHVAFLNDTAVYIPWYIIYLMQRGS